MPPSSAALCSLTLSFAMKSQFPLALLVSILSISVAQLIDTVCHQDGSCTEADIIDTVSNVEDANECLDICKNWPSRECQSWTFGVDNKNCFLFRNKCEIGLVGLCTQPGECVSGNDPNCLPNYDCDLTVRCNGPTYHVFENYTSQDQCLQSCKEFEAKKDLPGQDVRGCPYYTWEFGLGYGNYESATS